jgi:hypothetical protein
MVCSSDGHRDDNRLSLLWSVAATGANVMVPVAAVTSSSDGWLTLNCPSLLLFTVETSNLTSDYPVTTGQIQILT